MTAMQIIKRTESMKERRTNFDSHWQQIRDFINDTHPAFQNPIEVPGTQTRGQVWSNKAERASEQLANGLHGALTNPGTDWFTLRAQDPAVNDDYDAGVWLEDTARRIRAVFDSPSTHFGTQLNTIYRVVGDFGTTGLYVRARRGRLPIFQARPLSELYLGEDENGVVNRVHRCFKLTASQAVSQFGNDASEEVRKAAETPSKADEPFEFIHALYPRMERIEGLTTATNMPIASDWIDVKSKQYVQRSGFQEMPLVTPRWDVKAGEVYGRSVGMKALADTKSLQHLMKLTFRAAEKTIDPPLQVADDGIEGPIRTKASAINRVSSDVLARIRGGGIVPIGTGANPQLGLEMVEYIGREIEFNYFSHLLQISRDPRMTATQVLEITEEMLRTLGPFLNRLQEELLGPLIKRVFGILARENALLPPPPSIALAPVKIEYLSPAVRAQRLSEARAIAQFEELTVSMVARDPAITDNINGDDAYNWLADRLGVPKDIRNSPQNVARMRQGRQQAQQEQRLLEQATALAPAAQSAAQAVAAISPPTQ
jgi:hypothetical protein